MKACPKCQSEMTFKRGTSKKGKAYAGWFCTADKNECGFVEWDDKPAPATPQGRFVPAASKPVPSEKTMVLSYAKDLVCARIKAGEKIEFPADEVLRLFNVLYNALKEAPVGTNA